jgi:hypothetical protein
VAAGKNTTPRPPLGLKEKLLPLLEGAFYKANGKQPAVENYFFW